MRTALLLAAGLMVLGALLYTAWRGPSGRMAEAVEVFEDELDNPSLREPALQAE